MDADARIPRGGGPDDSLRGQTGPTVSPPGPPPIPFHRGKAVGRLSKDGCVFTTRRVRDRHLARRHNGYGLQSKLLDDLLASGVERIVIREVADGRLATYETTPALWRQHGVLDVLRRIDGAQRFLSLKQLRDHTARVVPPPEDL